MAKIYAMPSLAIVKGLKGKLDFYEWKGVACVRKWPRTPRSHLTTGTRSLWPVWGYITQQVPNTSPETIAALRTMIKATQLVWRDQQANLYYAKTITISLA